MSTFCARLSFLKLMLTKHRNICQRSLSLLNNPTHNLKFQYCLVCLYIYYLQVTFFHKNIFNIFPATYHSFSILSRYCKPSLSQRYEYQILMHFSKQTTSCSATKFGWHVAESSLYLPTFSLPWIVRKNIYHFFSNVLEINFQKIVLNVC
jgi:hypothetical protein